MKLSKDELIRLVRSNGTELGTVEDVFRAEFVVYELKKNRLEIEGYVREDDLNNTSKMVDKWTKFDADDPKTFPKVEMDYIVLLNYGEIKVIKWWESIQSFTINYNPNITHWRPLPSLPVE